MEIINKNLSKLPHVPTKLYEDNLLTSTNIPINLRGM